MSCVNALSFICWLVLVVKCQAQGGNEAAKSSRLQRDLSYTMKTSNYTSDTICPTWFQPNVNSSDWTFPCACTSKLQSIIHCDNKTQTVFLSIHSCMTYDEKSGEYDVGSCPFSLHHQQVRGLSVKLPQNVSELNEFMCGGLNRMGRLCGKCKDGYGLAPYSAHMNCTQCAGSTGWGWYILIDFLCQTIFFAILFILKINVTSPTLNSFVLYAQICTSVNVIALFSLIENSSDLHSFSGPGAAFLTLINIWKLDFFIAVAPPTCLAENLSALQIGGLRYLSAFYPLILIFLLYVLIKVQDMKWKPVVTLWKPLQKAKAKFSQYYELDQPVTKAFATVFLLSYVKIADVSYSLLLPTQLYNARGQPTEKMWFYDASVRPFQGEHIGYGILSLMIFFTYIFIPPLLLFLYPFKAFQRCLSKLKYGQSTIKIFMDIMQCHYKDGLDGKWDLRSFSAVYFWIRFVFIFVRLSSVYYGWHYSILSLMFTACAIFVAIIRPYKKNRYNFLDCFFLSLLGLEFHIYFIVIVYSALSSVFVSWLYLLFLLLGFSPLIYFFGYLTHHLCTAIKLPGEWQAALDKRWLKLRIVLRLNKQRRYTIASDHECTDIELPDRCVHPELYDTFLNSYNEENDRPATI